MHPQWSAEAEGRYQERLLEQQRSGYRTATLLAVVLFPAFSLLDLLTQRQAFATLSLIRFSTSIVFAALHLAARRNRYPAGPYLSGVLLLILASSSITAMCLVLDGYRSPYYAGVNLVVLAGVLLFPWTARRMTAAVSIVIGIWLLGTLVQCGFHVDRPDLLINNSYFLIATGVIGVAAAGLGDRLRREAFAWGEAKSALELRDQFVSIASHELRTPITSLKLQLDLMRRRALKESASGGEAALRTTQSIDRLGGQVQRLTHLVDQMLDLSRVRSGRLALEPQPIDLRELLTQVLGQLSDEFAQAGVEVTLHKPDAPVEGSWDPFRIEQVITNLLTNALKYGRGHPVEAGVRNDGDAAVLEVRDHGPGIPAADRDRIFHRFERAGAPSTIGGLGLGLFITREIVEAHGGTIAAEEAPGGGALFRVRLPRASAKPQSAKS